jgi:hypothetical protein
MFQLNKKEAAIFKKLSTPIKIQNFLDTLPRNNEKGGDTCFSPRRVLREKKAHCIEGALLAAAALWYHGVEPLVMDLQASNEDFDHVICLYKYHGRWGAISKTNHLGLRWRDPVYQTPRELAMSYFHEYLHDTNHKKTMRRYSVPINLKRFGEQWITSEENLFDLAGEIDSVRHYPVAPAKNLRLVRLPDKMERRANKVLEWHKTDSRT